MSAKRWTAATGAALLPVHRERPVPVRSTDSTRPKAVFRSPERQARKLPLGFRSGAVMAVPRENPRSCTPYSVTKRAAERQTQRERMLRARCRPRRSRPVAASGNFDLERCALSICGSRPVNQAARDRSSRHRLHHCAPTEGRQPLRPAGSKPPVARFGEYVCAAVRPPNPFRAPAPR
jgi:hypothetical protein